MRIDCKALLWHKPSEVEAPKDVADWLMDERSLTQKLKWRYAKFRLQLLLKQQQLPHRHECLCLALNQPMLIREVFLLDDKTPLVFARSIIPQTADTAVFTALEHQPLGEALFNAAGIQKLALSISQQNGIWGRRHVFQIKQTKLLVCEFFLPDLFNISR